MIEEKDVEGEFNMFGLILIIASMVFMCWLGNIIRDNTYTYEYLEDDPDDYNFDEKGE